MAGTLIFVGIIILLVALVLAGRIRAPFGRILRPLGIVAGGICIAAGAFQGIFFYAEPGFKYHVRTILGEEKMVSDVGYNTHLFGRYNAWKNAMSVQRFQLPEVEEDFLRLARQFRTPENLLRTELIPAFQETLGATASLVSAENYFSGGRNEFNTEFQNQMQGGIYNVRRKEETRNVRRRSGSANAALGTEQQEFGDDQQIVFVVEKILDENGQPVRKPQNFNKFTERAFPLTHGAKARCRRCPCRRPRAAGARRRATPACDYTR